MANDVVSSRGYAKLDGCGSAPTQEQLEGFPTGELAQRGLDEGFLAKLFGPPRRQLTNTQQVERVTDHGTRIVDPLTPCEVGSIKGIHSVQHGLLLLRGEALGLVGSKGHRAGVVGQEGLLFEHPVGDFLIGLLVVWLVEPAIHGARPGDPVRVMDQLRGVDLAGGLAGGGGRRSRRG